MFRTAQVLVSFERLLVVTAALCLLGTSAGAQVRTTDISIWEDSLRAVEWPARSRASAVLARRAPEITATGLTRLINLLRNELDGTASRLGGEAEGDEAYGEYIMTLTQVITRFNDQRATALLARQGIAITNGAVYQVAMAGDSGIGPLAASWTSNEHLRPAIVRTMAQMRYYADSVHAPLSLATRGTINDYLLRAATAPEEWVRRAFVDAATTIGDPAYLPVVNDIAAHDMATIDGSRYIANAATAAVPLLTSRRSSATLSSLLDALQAQQNTACQLNWIPKKGVCDALIAELRIAAHELARHDQRGVRALLIAYGKELTVLRGREISEKAYILLAENAQYIVIRL